MEVSVDEVRAGLRWLPRRRTLDRAASPARSAASTYVGYGIPRWELVGALVALFVLGRLPLLFLRLHTTAIFWQVRPLWQEDAVIASILGAVQLAVIVVAIWRAHPGVLLQQPLLIAFLAFAWLSISWSVEPGVSVKRALLMVGTAGVGWYIGDRLSLRDHIRLATWLGWVAIGTTFLALIFWSDVVRETNGNVGEWSGVYVNRNSLGLVLSIGILGSTFFHRASARSGWIRFMRVVMVLLLFATRSKTGIVGLGVAMAMALVVAWLRSRRSQNIGAVAAAYVVFAVFATTGLVVHRYWFAILKSLGRDPDLTGRTSIWQLVRWYSHLHPWRGWGFEAIWANRHAISQAQALHGSLNAANGHGIPGGWPFAAHNGYYEIMLGLGYIGLALLVAFLVMSAWRAFQFAWHRTDIESLWPFTFIVFAVVVNFSESLFVSGEALCALVVAAAIAVTVRRPGPHADETAQPSPEPITT